MEESKGEPEVLNVPEFSFPERQSSEEDENNTASPGNGEETEEIFYDAADH